MNPMSKFLLPSLVILFSSAALAQNQVPYPNNVGGGGNNSNVNVNPGQIPNPGNSGGGSGGAIKNPPNKGKDKIEFKNHTSKVKHEGTNVNVHSNPMIHNK
jgi:hypothetical protein